jgi:hypothetical protein
VSPASGRRLVRSVNWVLSANSSAEQADLWEEDDGWIIAGTVKAVVDEPIGIAYLVRCSTGWETRAVEVNETRQGRDRAFGLVVDAGQRWRMNGEPVPELDGCIDVDLGFTPSTNTLPIRRLGLQVGATADIVAAWIRFPGLDIVPATQHYTRLADRRYLYESGTFRAELDVDDVGLVVTYQGAWERVPGAASEPA